MALGAPMEARGLWGSVLMDMESPNPVPTVPRVWHGMSYTACPTAHGLWGPPRPLGPQQSRKWPPVVLNGSMQFPGDPQSPTVNQGHPVVLQGPLWPSMVPSGPPLSPKVPHSPKAYGPKVPRSSMVLHGHPQTHGHS